MAIRGWWRRLRTNWNRTDTLLYSSNTLALMLFIGNCWWEKVEITYGAVGFPLFIQAWRARRVHDALREAFVFGGLVGWLWPFGEWFVIHAFGPWGEYRAPGPTVLETPLYCILVGWVASTHCYYVGRRTLEIGYGKAVSAVMSGLTAFALGIIGENLFVGGGMWVYYPSVLEFGSVPAFVPVAYGLGYATIPMLRRLHMVPATLLFTVIMLFISVSLGLVVGFFPR